MAKQQPSDAIKRGQYGSDGLGTATFVGLRLVDPIWQHALITRHFGLSVLPRLFGGSILPPANNHSTALLPHLPPYQQLVLLMAAGSSAKHIIWQLAISREELDPLLAAEVGLFNNVMNSLNTAMSVWSRASLIDETTFESESLLQSPMIVAGAVLYLVGISVELLSEVQRAAFKNKSSNANKPYSGGLFGLLRHPNYTGYVLWRTGYALVCGGPVWAAAVGAFVGYDLSARAVPALDSYCQKRYGEQWTALCEKVPYSMLPGIY